MTNNDEIIKDSCDNNFITDVIEASNEVPVIVDFWAPWCEPCKKLTPDLEKNITTLKGKVKLVKINIDENQGIASQLRIQSIPAVFAFFKGKPIDGFMGAQTGTKIKEFITTIITKSGGEVDNNIDDTLESARIKLEDGLFEEARIIYHEILKDDEKNINANAGIIKTYIAQKNLNEATNKLNSLPNEIGKDQVFQKLNSEIELLKKVSDSRSSDDIKIELEKNPQSLDLRFELALSQIANEEYEKSIDNLLDIFKHDKDWKNGKAKEHLIQLFETLGVDHELVLRGRRKLSSMIFS